MFTTTKARTIARRVAPAALVGAVAAIAGVLASHGYVHALQAAGAFQGTPITGVENFINSLKGNLVWLGGTVRALVVVVVGLLFMAGHSRAQDYAIKTIVGLAIIASVGGIVA
jgi:hypothetical protein